MKAQETGLSFIYECRNGALPRRLSGDWLKPEEANQNKTLGGFTMSGIGYSYQGYEYYRVGAFWRAEKDGNRLPERFGTKTEVKKFIDVRIKKAKSGLKPGVSLPTSAREAKIMVEVSKMAKAKRVLSDMEFYIYDIELVPTIVKSTDGSDRLCMAAHVHFCDGTKKDSDGDVHEEKKIVYLD